MNLIQRIDRWAAAAPEAIAHLSGDRTLTYGELRRRSDGLASHLIKRFGNDRRPIAVLGHREPEMLIAFLGVVKSGRPYVPIDTALPQTRVDQILASSHAALSLTPDQIRRFSAGELHCPTTLVEKNEKTKIALLEEAMGWGEARRAAAPKDPNAHYFFAFAAGRYSQGISVVKALAQGLGGKVKEALLTTIKLEPKHADAHIAYGSYQAEVIDKVGGIVAAMTYGAKKDSAIEHFQKALKLNPDSAVARIEYANGLIMLFGKARMGDAEKLYQEAAGCKAADAMERLDVERARSELE